MNQLTPHTKLICHIKENSWIAKMGAKKLGTTQVALTIRNTIYLHNTKRADFLRNKAWVRHEVEHVLQYKKAGTIWFLLKYLYEGLVKGYTNISYEVQARNAEHDLALLDHVHFT
jgi:hypothetical protein